MTKLRYFKATDGHITVFRSSATRVYRSAMFTSVKGPQLYGGIVFCAKLGPIGARKAVEIDKAEYDQLVERKRARLKAGREAIIAAGGTPSYYRVDPQDSWVVNDAFDDPKGVLRVRIAGLDKDSLADEEPQS